MHGLKRAVSRETHRRSNGTSAAMVVVRDVGGYGPTSAQRVYGALTPIRTIRDAPDAGLQRWEVRTRGRHGRVGRKVFSAGACATGAASRVE